MQRKRIRNNYRQASRNPHASSAQLATLQRFIVSMSVVDVTNDNTYPREAVELGLVTTRQLGMHRSQGRLLASELLVEVTGIGSSVL